MTTSTIDAWWKDNMDNSVIHPTTTKSELIWALFPDLWSSMIQENWFHTPVHQEVHKHLDWNVWRIFLDQLKQKEVYTKFSICVDGREDGEWIASFWGFAGILWATIPALKELYYTDHSLSISPTDIIKWWLADTKFYVHCDDHTQHDTHGAPYHTCKKIGCGAINLMLKPDNAEAYGYSEEDRIAFWNLIDTNGQVKVLQGEHEEQWIISIENHVRKDKKSWDEYINHTKGNMKDWVQYFVNHVTGRNRIISYFAEDLWNYIANNYNMNSEVWFDQNDLTYKLKEAIMKWADIHANATLGLLWAAQKVLKEKGDNAVISLWKISNKWNHRFSPN